jgi:hypothetical protein
MRRRFGNLLATAVVAVGGWVLLSGPAEAQGGQSTCTSGNGQASCTGSTCCADETSCYTSEAICLAMYCDQHPEAQSCQQQPGT